MAEGEGTVTCDLPLPCLPLGCGLGWCGRDTARHDGLHDPGLRRAQEQSGANRHAQGARFGFGKIDHDGGKAGIGGRVDPAIEPHRLRGLARGAPVEGGKNAPCPLRTGNQKRGAERQQNGEAEGIGITRGEVGAGRMHFERGDHAADALLVGLPECVCGRCVGGVRQMVGIGCGGLVGQP